MKQKEKGEKVKKMQKEVVSKIEGLNKSNKELNVRESKAEQLLKPACAFLDGGNERIAKGQADKDLGQIENHRGSLNWHRKNKRKQKMKWKAYTWRKGN